MIGRIMKPFAQTGADMAEERGIVLHGSPAPGRHYNYRPAVGCRARRPDADFDPGRAALWTGRNCRRPRALGAG